MRIKIKACFFICAVFVVSALVFHQPEDSAAKQGKQGDTLKERIIRVPVSDMKAVTDKKPEGIFIPYNEYRDLYERAKKAFFSQKGEEDNMMTQEPFVTQAVIKGKYRKNLIKFRAGFTIVNNRKEPVQIPLPFKRVKFRRMSLDKKPVHLEDRNGVPVILISTPGVHELFVEFDTDVRFYDKKAVVDFEIPKPLIGEIEIESADMADIRFSGLPMMASSRQAAVGSRQLAVGRQQSAVSSRQSAVGNRKSAVGSQQSAVSSQQIADSWLPTANCQLPTFFFSCNRSFA